MPSEVLMLIPTSVASSVVAVRVVVCWWYHLTIPTAREVPIYQVFGRPASPKQIQFLHF